MSISAPAMFKAMGLPARLFGQVYVIVSVWKSLPTTWEAEYNVLSNRPQENLFSGVVSFDTKDYPVELQPIDAVYMEAEAVRQAEIVLMLELEKRAVADDVALAYLPFKLERTQLTPVTLWVSNTFPSKFLDMTSETKSKGLRNYLRLVMGLQKLKAD